MRKEQQMGSSKKRRRPVSLVFLFVDPGEPDITHSLLDLYIRGRSARTLRVQYDRGDALQPGTTSLILSCPSCNPSRSTGRMLVPAGHPDHRVAQRHGNIATRQSDIEPQLLPNTIDLPPPSPCPSARPTLERNSVQPRRWQAQALTTHPTPINTPPSE